MFLSRSLVVCDPWGLSMMHKTNFNCLFVQKILQKCLNNYYQLIHKFIMSIICNACDGAIILYKFLRFKLCLKSILKIYESNFIGEALAYGSSASSRT